MCDGIFLHKSFESSIAEMNTIITNYGSKGSEAGDMFSFKNLTITLLSFDLQGMASTYLDTVHSHQNVLVSK